MASSQQPEAQQSETNREDNRRKACAIMNQMYSTPYVYDKNLAEHMNDYLAAFGQCAIKGCNNTITITTMGLGFYWINISPAPATYGIYVCPGHGDGKSKDPSVLYECEGDAFRAFLELRSIKMGNSVWVGNWEFLFQKCSFEVAGSLPLEIFCNKIYKGDDDVWDEDRGEKKNADGTVPEMKWVCYRPGCLQSAKNWAKS